MCDRQTLWTGRCCSFASFFSCSSSLRLRPTVALSRKTRSLTGSNLCSSSTFLPPLPPDESQNSCSNRLPTREVRTTLTGDKSLSATSGVTRWQAVADLPPTTAVVSNGGTNRDKVGRTSCHPMTFVITSTEATVTRGIGRTRWSFPGCSLNMYGLCHSLCSSDAFRRLKVTKKLESNYLQGVS